MGKIACYIFNLKDIWGFVVVYIGFLVNKSIFNKSLIELVT